MNITSNNIKMFMKSKSEKLNRKTITLDEETENKIKKISEKEDRSFSYIVNLALQEYLKKN